MREKVDFLLPSFAAGGAERVMLEWLTAAAEHYDCQLIVLSENGPLRTKLPDHIRLINLGEIRARQAPWRLRRYLREREPHILLSTMAYMNFAALLAARFSKTSTMLVVREANTPLPLLSNGMTALAYRSAYRLLYNAAASVVSPSSLIRDQLAGLAVAPKKIRIVSNPVDEARLRERAGHPTRPEDIRGRFFVAAGRLVRQKGFDNLIRMAKQLNPDDQVWILGDGPDHVELARLILENTGGALVSLKGFIPDISPLLAAADAFLMPSRWEGMPNAALEALALGVPVIASPTSGGLVELVAGAPDSAITIAEPYDEFISSMHAVKPPQIGEHIDQLFPRRSLLPTQHTIKHSTDSLLELFTQLLKS